MNAAGATCTLQAAGRTITDDLSSMPGRQTGRFRVYLLVRGVDFSLRNF
jgi:hypothetical protein